MAAIEFRVDTAPGKDPTITASFRPRLRRGKEVYLHGGFYPLPEGEPHIIAALLSYDGTAAALNDVFQAAFEIGQRHERMRLTDEAARAAHLR